MLTIHNQNTITALRTMDLVKAIEESGRVTYLVGQLEKGSTEHFQGFIIMKVPCRLAAIKKLFNDNTLHGELAISRSDQCRDYCTKEDSRVPASGGGFDVEMGTFPQSQGTEVIDLTQERTVAEAVSAIEGIESVSLRGSLELPISCVLLTMTDYQLLSDYARSFLTERGESRGYGRGSPDGASSESDDDPNA